VTAISAILCRLDAGRPLIVGGDPLASFAARGVDVSGPAPLGRLVRELPEAIAQHYEREIAAGVDVLCALTAETTTRALARIGMGYRAAALTGTAVEHAQAAVERAIRPVAIAGALGGRGTGVMQPERLAEEYAMHAARLAAAGCDIIIARGVRGAGAPSGLVLLARRAAVIAAASTDLPAWACIEIDRDGGADHGSSVEDAVSMLVAAGAQVVILEVPSVDVGLAATRRARPVVAESSLGVLVDAPDARDTDAEALARWATAVKTLVSAGVRVVGGGKGTVPTHTAALAKALGRSDPTSIWPRAV
jgi:5-methyltetrahydrofolate--homocysteine methyltransferase